MPSYYFNVWFSRRRSIKTGHEWIWYTALRLDKSGTDLNGERWGNELSLFPHHVHHHSGGNADSRAKIVPLPPSSDNRSSAHALLWPSPPSVPAPHCLLLQLHIHRKALSVTPIRAPKFQKKLPARHNYPAAISTTVFHCYKTCLCTGWYTGSHTGREQTPWATWPYVLLDSPATPPALHPPLHETLRIVKRS